ncbi:MAG: sigma-70 family RNA polymerase sigma factor [Cytophagales bacterium]|nr:sigma-70 family RNA polymerase sigma factor [Cytophagales bacterium]
MLYAPKFSGFFMLIIIGLAVFERWKRSFDISDDELLSKYSDSQDNRYFAELFKRYTHLVYGVCMKYLKDSDNSKDAVMQIFEKLMEDLKTKKVENFGHWVQVVAKNYCLMQLRKVSFEDHGLEIENLSVPVVENDVQMHPMYDTERNIQLLEQGLGELGHEQQICVKLFYMEEKSYAEIAEQTGYALGQVKSYIQNGKRNLYNYMIKNNVASSF